MEVQKHREFMEAPYEHGKTDPADYIINTLNQFNAFVNYNLRKAERQPTVILIETKGDSNAWVKARKRLDGGRYFKNEESSGVTVILINVLHRDEDIQVAFIDVENIVNSDLDGDPNLPANFYNLLRHRQVIVAGDHVFKHLKRLENSFGRLDNVLYVTVEDLTNRVTRYKKNEGVNTWDVVIDPTNNNALIFNFHTIFPQHTYFKNPYEVLADWSDISELRDSQLKHALNKIWFTGILVEKVLDYFKLWKFSLSIMGTIYPRCQAEEREDFHFRNYIKHGEEPPRWYNEQLWPCGPMHHLGVVDRESCLPNPDQVRLNQEEDEKKRRRSRFANDEDPDRKRKYADSDVSADEDGDQAFLKRKIGENKTIRRAEKAARNLKVNCSATNLKNWLAPDDHDDILFVATVVKNMGGTDGRRNIGLIFGFYTFWPDERKARLVNHLARNGFFAESSASSPYQAMSRLNNLSPDLKLILQMDVNGATMADYMHSRIIPDHVRRVLDELETYFTMSKDERSAQLEACPFYVEKRRHEYLSSDEKILDWIYSIYNKCNQTPGDVILKFRRHKFIDEVIEWGRQGFVSAKNATEMVARHVGEDYNGRNDAVLMSVRWPLLSELLHQRWGLPGFVRRIFDVDPNLKQDAMCRRNFHVGQTITEVTTIRDQAEADKMMEAMAYESFMVLIERPNRDPRSVDANPSLVAFQAPGRAIYCIFPHDIDEKLRKIIYGWLRSKSLFLRYPKETRKWLTSPGDEFSSVGLGYLGRVCKVGRSSDSLCYSVWGSRFCVISKEEWLADPLNEIQTYHLAYEVDLMSSLVYKLSLDVVLSHVKRETIPTQRGRKTAEPSPPNE